MSETKEKILLSSLRLFAERGYDAVSVNDIANELGVTKGALYKHYKNKRNIFENIVSRMEKLDYERAKEFDVPENTIETDEEQYKNTPLSSLIAFTRAQFDYWTKEEFPSCFRKMLTVEQFKSDEMKKLYSQYLVSGPFGYVKDIFNSAGVLMPEQKAFALYSAMFFHFALFDEAKNKNEISESFEKYLSFFCERLLKEGEKEHE